MSDTVPCPYCQGSGEIPVDACADMVGSHRCRRLAKPDPAFFEDFPRFAHLSIYCVRHRNARIRGMADDA